LRDALFHRIANWTLFARVEIANEEEIPKLAVWAQGLKRCVHASSGTIASLTNDQDILGKIQREQGGSKHPGFVRSRPCSAAQPVEVEPDSLAKSVAVRKARQEDGEEEDEKKDEPVQPEAAAIAARQTDHGGKMLVDAPNSIAACTACVWFEEKKGAGAKERQKKSKRMDV
jgi:hypothetical protein